VLGDEAYLHAKFDLDSSNRLATVQYTSVTDRTRATGNGVSMLPEIPGGNSREFGRFSKIVIFVDSDSSILRIIRLFELRFGEQAEQH